ncbi:MAG: CHAT domain-containing protein [Cyanobacteria bacterium P01_F01_bin.150]
MTLRLTWVNRLLGIVISSFIVGIDSPSLANSFDLAEIPQREHAIPQPTPLQRVREQLDQMDQVTDSGTFVDSYPLSLDSGESVGITLESLVFDVYLQLLDGIGQVLVEVDDIDDLNSNAFILFTADSSDNYEIRATSYAPAIGDYVLTIEHDININQALPQLSDDALTQVEARRFRAQGIAALDQGDMEQALAALTLAQANYESVGDRAGEASAWYNQGRVYVQLGRTDEAIAAYEQSASLHRDNNNQRGESVALNSLGLIYTRTGQYAEAQQTYTRALTLVRAIGEHVGEATILTHLGSAYKFMGNYPKALETYNQSLTLSRNLQDSHAEGITLNNMGALYYLVGRYDVALEHYETALNLVQGAGDHVNQISILTNIGVMHQDEGRFEEAMEIHQQALDLAISLSDVRKQGVIYNNIGVIHYELGDYSAALAVYEQALTIVQQVQDKRREAIILSNMGVILEEQGKLDEALKQHQAALAIASKSELQGFALNNIGSVLLVQGKLDEAIAYFFDSIEALEALRVDLEDRERIDLIDAQRSPYLSLQQALIQQKQIDKALEIAERNRAQAFVELLAQRSQPQSQVTVEPLTLDTITEIAQRQQTTFVEYSLMNDDRLFIWVIQPNGNITFRESDLTPLRSQRRSQASGPKASLDVRLERTPGRQRRQLRQLYNQLIVPIVDLLPNDPDARVTFVPQSELLLVPFAALLDESGEYLIQQHTILTVPSIQALSYIQLAEGASTPQAPLPQAYKNSNDIIDDNSKYLVVGNPVMPALPSLPGELPTPLAPLPASEQEALTIGQLLDSPVFTGHAAIESVVQQQMPESKLIHLATHGLLNYGIPDESNVQDMPGAIVLAPSPDKLDPITTTNNDGLLSSKEILELDLQADLVVLSACDTGLGRITGDGVVGLSRSFLAAGASSVVVSLWAVPDTSTAELMVAFYKNLIQGHDKGQSLRYAMLETLEQYPNPLDWAAFILVGNADSQLFLEN